MFRKFRKPEVLVEQKVEENHYLPEEIKVDNLKEYVVKGFELEKELKAEIERLKNSKAELIEKVKENEIQAVVLSDYKHKISNLERKAEFSEAEIEKIKTELLEKKSSLNDYIIRARQGETEYQKGLKDGKERAVLILTELINNHKGNLSKQQVLDYLEEVTV